MVGETASKVKTPLIAGGTALVGAAAGAVAKDRLAKTAAGVMDLKTMAISRLMLDNFPHIKAYWVMLGIKTAQVALSFGADDIDGTIVHETIYHSAGADTPQEITVAEIRRLIAEAGRIPVERDTLYHKVERDGAHWSSGEAIRVAALTA